MKHIVIFAAFSILIGMQSYGYDENRARVSFGVFFDALQPYGEWVDISDFGYCWHPAGIDRHWRPYMNGRWVWSDYGWYWVSYDDWGWAPYHYGRWMYDDYYGWIWVPDYEWGPSWVQWRYTNGYIGWAPLPPRAGFHFSIGIDIGDYGVPYFGWCFTAGSGFYNDHPRIFGVEQNHHLIRITRNVTNIRTSDRGIINRGLDYRDVERMGRSRISPVRVENERGFSTGRGDRFEGNRLRVYRPEVRPETRNDIETRVRGEAAAGRDAGIPGGTSGRSSDINRGGRRVEQPENRGDAGKDFQRPPDNQSERRIDRENANPAGRGNDHEPMKNEGGRGMRDEIQNRHPQLENQPRFNIPERREGRQREFVPERRNTPAQAPQIERRRTEQPPPAERRNEGPQRSGNRRR
ncbi:MAG: DUF6600 domain-containing protein [Bacteroidota bacterium]